MLDTYAAVYAGIFAEMKFILVWKVMQSSTLVFKQPCALIWYFPDDLRYAYRQRGLVG